MKTILVTGGAGFVGSHLCRRLAEDGHRVISLDNYFTGTPDNHVPGVEYRKGHTRDVLDLVSESPDLVFHLGEYSRVEKSFEDPIELIWDLNVAGTFSILEFCRRKQSKLVYAGSSTKFAEGGMGRQMSPYAWTKASNTDIVKNYGDWFGLRYAITYFYNVFGEGEIASGPYATVVGIFKQEYRSGLPITVVSPGTQKRCFTHVSDIVEGLCLVAEHGEGDGYGIGNQESYSILEVAGLFGENIIMLPERKGNRQNSSLDASKMHALGWSANVSLRDHVEAFKRSCERGASKEKRVLVFCTTFYPNEGPAERALRLVMERMPDVQFDVITSLHRKIDADHEQPLPNVHVYRIGTGGTFDKYKLLFAGYRKVMELIREHEYLFLWSIMASYGTIVATLARRKTHLPLLISFGDQRFGSSSVLARQAIRVLCRQADQLSFAFIEQQEGLSRLDPSLRLMQSNRQGDVFVNAMRFLYNDYLRRDKDIHDFAS